MLRVESLFGETPAGDPPEGQRRRHPQSAASRRLGESVRGSDRSSPSYIADVARATRQLLESQAPAGLYHCVNSGACTWLEFGREMARLLGVEPRLIPVRMADAQLRARASAVLRAVQRQAARRRRCDGDVAGRVYAAIYS